MSVMQITINNKTFPNASGGKEVKVIANLQLSLNAGEFVCLIGPSGCGKTSLLNIVAGLDLQFAGKIKLGQQLESPSIGYVFQNPRLLPWRTARENIELALPDDQAPEIIDSLLHSMNLLDTQNAYPERLSLGMSRRIAIARAFAIKPKILLMDEPFVSLDPPTARQTRSLLLNLWLQRPISTLFVTHNLDEAIILADRLVFLSSTPMAVIADIPVKITRKQRKHMDAITQFKNHLINEYPAISHLL